MKQVETETADNGTLAHSIVEAVTEAENVTYDELTPPLNEVIDPDALNELFAQRPSVGKVVFNYNSCEVSVFTDGYVMVEKHGEKSSSRSSSRV